MAKRRTAANVGAGRRLARHAVVGRADELLEERKRLLGEVEKKRRAIEKTQAEVRRLTELGLERMRPILELSQKLTAALELLLTELLTDSKLPSRASSAGRVL